MSITLAELLGVNVAPVTPAFRQSLTPEEMALGPCEDGTRHRVTLSAVLSRRGVKMISATCFACEAQTAYIPYAKVTTLFGTTIDAVQVGRNNLCRHCNGHGCSECCGRCQRCREYKPTHGHHTAPYALFVDANLWPVVDLCAECHTYWHSVMTPGMRKTPATVAPHLSTEWDEHAHARDRRTAHSWQCKCQQCEAAQAIIHRFNEKYGYMW